MEKLLAMNIAAMLTDASCGNAGSPLAVSPDISDAQVRAKNLQVWETFRIFYRGVIGALTDDTDWPPPQIPVGNLAQSIVQSTGPGLVGALAPLVSGTGPLAPIIKQLLAAIPLPKPATPLPATPIPDPGAKPKT